MSQNYTSVVIVGCKIPRKLAYVTLTNKTYIDRCCNVIFAENQKFNFCSNCGNKLIKETQTAVKRSDFFQWDLYEHDDDPEFVYVPFEISKIYLGVSFEFTKNIKHIHFNPTDWKNSEEWLEKVIEPINRVENCGYPIFGIYHFLETKYD